MLEYAGNIGRVQGLNRVIEQLPDGVEFHLYGTGAMEQKLREMKQPNVFFMALIFVRSKMKYLLLVISQLLRYKKVCMDWGSPVRPTIF